MKMTPDEVANELERCKEDPLYFCEKYIKINGEPFVSSIPREHFNEAVKAIGKGNQVLYFKRRSINHVIFKP
jgi:hypothetical protein